MFSRIWAAFGRIADGASAVADSLFGLAATFRAADEHARERLGLAEQPAAALIEAPAEPPRGGKKKAGAA